MIEIIRKNILGKF